MESIFIITSNHPETRGQGDFATMKKLATYGGAYEYKQYPAFKSREDAQKFIDENRGQYQSGEITELPIWKG